MAKSQGKCHWDFLIEEIEWLAGVSQQEIKTKIMVAEKCATMVQKHFKDHELAVHRAEKAKEVNLRSIASNMLRETTCFEETLAS